MNHRKSKPAERRPRSSARTRQLALEVLESRQLLSASGLGHESDPARLEHDGFDGAERGAQTWAPVQSRADTIELHARADDHREPTRAIESGDGEDQEAQDFGEPVRSVLAASATSEPPLAARSSSVMLAEPESASQPLQPVVPSLLQPFVLPIVASPIVSQPIVVLIVHVSEPIAGMSSEMAPPASRPSRAPSSSTALMALTSTDRFGLTSEAAVGQPPSSAALADARETLSQTTPVSLVQRSLLGPAEIGWLATVADTWAEPAPASSTRDATGLPAPLRSDFGPAVSAAAVDRLLGMTADDRAFRPLGEPLSPQIEAGFFDLLSIKPRSRLDSLAATDLGDTPSRGLRSQADRNVDAGDGWADLALRLRGLTASAEEGEHAAEVNSAAGSVWRETAAALAMSGRLQLELPADLETGGMVVIEAAGRGYLLESPPGPARGDAATRLVGGASAVQMDAVCGRLQAFEVAEEAAATDGQPVSDGGPELPVDAAVPGHVSASAAAIPAHASGGLRDTPDTRTYHGVLVPVLLALLPQLTSRQRAPGATAAPSIGSAVVALCRRVLRCAEGVASRFRRQG